jgi:LacI family transcriptional regulator
MVPTSSAKQSSQRAETKVADVLRQQIRNRYYRPGDRLPTERILAEDLNVDRRVVRTAINELVRDGVVTRRPGCRPVVGSLNGEQAGEQGAAASSASTSSPISDFIALSMWPGDGVLEDTATSQQRIFWGMNYALKNAGYHAVFLALDQVSNEEMTAEREAEHLRYVLEHGFAGMVFYPYAYRSNHVLVQEVARKVPMVMIDRRIPSVEVDFVGVDNRQATFDMTMSLIRQGHKRIAYVTKCEQIHTVQDRIQGYLDAVHRERLTECVLVIPSAPYAQGWTVADLVFGLPRESRPTAVVAFNDYATVDVIHSLERMGLSVPQDLALTGFDNIVSTLPNGVGLTTIAQPYEEIGQKAVELLLRRIKAPDAPKLAIELPASIVMRESTITPAVERLP